MKLDTFTPHLAGGKGCIQIDHYGGQWRVVVAMANGPMVTRQGKFADETLRVALVESDRLLRDGARVRQATADAQLDIEDAIDAAADPLTDLLG